MNNIWKLTDARKNFSEILKSALVKGVQIITIHGKNAVVFMSYEEYERLTQSGKNLSDYLLASPLLGSELSIERDKGDSRTIDIEP